MNPLLKSQLMVLFILHYSDAGRAYGLLKAEWWGAGMVIYQGRAADLHMAQLMPLPLTVSCFSKITLVLPFWYQLTQVVADKGRLNGCCCELVCKTRPVKRKKGTSINRKSVETVIRTPLKCQPITAATVITRISAVIILRIIHFTYTLRNSSQYATHSGACALFVCLFMTHEAAALFAC